MATPPEQPEQPAGASQSHPAAGATGATVAARRGSTTPRSGRPDPFDELGRQIAVVLRTANAEAERVRAESLAEAETIRAEARVQAAELHAEADRDRDEAKRLLVRARERAEQLVSEAEQKSALIVSEADQIARTRVAAVMETGRARLQRLSDEEQRGRDRLLAAQEELDQVIRRISRPVPVIDLTAPEPEVRFGMRPTVPGAPAPASGPEPVLGDPAPRLVPSVRPVDPGPPDTDTDATHREDPLTIMVQSAVHEAVAHSVPRTSAPSDPAPAPRGGTAIDRDQPIDLADPLGLAPDPWPPPDADPER